MVIQGFFCRIRGVDGMPQNYDSPKASSTTSRLLAHRPSVISARELALPLPLPTAHSISYWDCYYRGAISRYLDYPGFRAIDAAIRTAKG
jgi:hypothetical protein